MPSLPLVSVITIVYNGEAFLEKTIKSVLDQTYPHIEYIIIDGGSTDGTVEIIRKYESGIALWISEKDKGISDAFNKGVARAKGEIIGIINADDWYEPNAVENVVNAMTDADIIYGNLRFWKGDMVEYVQEGNHHLLINEMTVNHPTVFVRKECYDRLGLFSEDYRIAMDYDVMLRFFVNKFRFRHIPYVIANMRWAGVSDKQWKRGCRETLLIKNKYLPQNKLRNRLYYYKHYMAIYLPRLLKKMGMERIVKFYRSRFSSLKKTYS